MGVMPAGFRFVDPDVQLWTPAAYPPEERADDRRHNNNWQQMGRLRPGATIEQAQAQIDAVNAANFERFPQFKTILTNVGFRTFTRPLQTDLVENARRTLYFLWGGVIAVLLIGCVNVANLVSVRATARARELATRHALGASLSRLTRQLFTETMVIAVVGGVLGLALGAWAL
jgi:ABC-type antimicrobial peptide transport system permease subunit